jgi:hypothetical protein
MDGSGFPRRTVGDQLSLLTKIVMVVDEYDQLINQPDQSKPLAPAEAISYLYQNGKEAFSSDAVVALIQTLSVYPPGTIVELSDKRIGLVISINFKARMKLIIVLYNPSVSPTEPDIVNLADHPRVTVAGSLPRRDLPPEILDYLSLDRWTAYFIHSSMEAVQEQKVV